MTVYTPGRRKLVLGSAAFAALCFGAWLFHASFVEFRDGLLTWLGAMLAAHVTAERLGKAPVKGKDPTP